MPASACPVHVLPTELLITIFHAIRAVSSDPSSANASLCSAALVCRRWSAAACHVLLSRVELARPSDALALLSKSRDGFIDELTIAMGGAKDSQNIIDDNLFLQLTSAPCTSRVRKLQVLHHSSMACITRLPTMPLLTDVTLAAAGGAPATLSETSFIMALPSSVRFLSLPCPERTRFAGACAAPAFKLFGLTVQEYPSPTATWLVDNQEAGPALQCLDTVFLSSIDRLAKFHPNLRSLRVLQRLGSEKSFAPLTNLERLELRDTAAKKDSVESLPANLRYFRFWSTEVAAALPSAIEAGTLPNLHTLVWDWFAPNSPAQRDAAAGAMQRLQAACAQRGIHFQAYERKDGGRRASKGKDFAYESYMRASCYRVASEPIPSYTPCPSSSRLPTRVLKDIYHSGLPLGPHLKAISPFMNNVTGMWSPVWEDTFQGHGVWLEETIPQLEARKKAQSPAPKSLQSSALSPRASSIPKRSIF